MHSGMPIPDQQRIQNRPSPPRPTGLRGLVLVGVLMVGGVRAAAADDAVLVSVNGRPVTAADLQLEAVLRRVPADELDVRRDELLSELIDQKLMETFLQHRRVKANPRELNLQVDRVHELIRRRGEEPDALFKRLGLDEDRLRERLSLTLAWTEYVRRATSDQQLRAYFDEHRRELDGTQLRASHILKKATPNDSAGREHARKTLAEIESRIAAGEITFEDAAAQHSEAPSAQQGGDVGFLAHRGTMPADFADAAFALDVGETSEPVETPFGVHLIKVTQERPGQLSLEDVRPQIIERLSLQMWSEQVARDRPRATIEPPR